MNFFIKREVVVVVRPVDMVDKPVPADCEADCEVGWVVEACGWERGLVGMTVTTSARCAEYEYGVHRVVQRHRG